jgi:threonine synthase
MAVLLYVPTDELASEVQSVNVGRLEQQITHAFRMYEMGYWPVSARHEARLIIQTSLQKA